MIDYIQRDITETQCPILIHGCNAQGKMGAGVALAIRRKWPAVFESYINHLKNNDFPLGTVGWHHEDQIDIANMITQINYGRTPGVKYASILAIGNALNEVCRRTDPLVQIAIASPKVGCSLGGLDWNSEVLPIYEAVNQSYPHVDFLVYSQ